MRVSCHFRWWRWGHRELVPIAVLLMASLSSSSLRAEALTVAINEVAYRPLGDQRADEFVELWNWGDEAADLSGWSLLGGVQFVFAQGTRIPAGEFLVVAADRARTIDRHALSASQVVGDWQGSLSNGGEDLSLWSASGYRVSLVVYGDEYPWPETADGLGPSLERVSPLREENDPRAWRASLSIDGTPGALNSVYVAANVEAPPVDEQPLSVLIPATTEWRFRRGREEPPGDWRQPDFDDSDWGLGPAGFGYGDDDDRTVLDDMMGEDGYTSVYVRRRFVLESPPNAERLLLRIIADDGYVAWLNGVEVDRYQVEGEPGDPVPFDATASVGVEGVRREVDLSASIPLLQSGENVLCLIGLNASRNSSDFSLDPSLVAEVMPGSPRQETLVERASEWRYFEASSAPAAGWLDSEFDDSGWARGEAGFGYGDFDDRTVLDNMQGAYRAVFLRQRFHASQLDSITSVSLEVLYDDGFAAYLNGQLVASANLASGDWDDVASGSHEAEAYEVFSLPPGALQAGENTLAIQGHNAALDSSDFSLGAALRVMRESDIIEPPVQPPAPEDTPRDLVINEVFRGLDGAAWIELWNPTDAPVDASGRRLISGGAERFEAVLPAGSVVPSRSWRVFDEADLGHPLAVVSVVALTLADGSWVDGLDLRTTAAGESNGRIPDGSDSRRVLAVPTRGAANELDVETSIVIHEISYNPPAFGEPLVEGEPPVELGQLEFIELYHRGNSAVDLSGWAFTRGVSWTFPPSTTMAPGEYLVIARDPAAVESFYGIGGVLGPWTGALRGDAETITLRDGRGNPVDTVRYADEGSWPEEPDGRGPTLELIHPLLENRRGAAWRASSASGTPGAPNSRAETDPMPIAVDVLHSPLVPTSSDAVRVTVRLSDEQDLESASVHWVLDGSGDDRAELELLDDGVADDGIAANGVWGAVVPAQEDGAIVAFWIEARSVTGQVERVPSPDFEAAFLWQVDDSDDATDRPLWRVILREATLDELESRSVGNDRPLDMTLIADGRVWYNRGIRYRGSSARRCDPLSYRLQFDHDVSFGGIKRVNLNGCETYRQWIGLDFLSRTGLPTPESWFRRLSINGDVDSRPFLRVEAIDGFFIEKHFPEDADGNLYRGVGQANLDYRGPESDPYRSHYGKRSNVAEGDFSDIPDLAFRFDAATTSDEDFPAAIEDRVDVDQWALFFAAFAMVGSTENSILLDNGDDYFLYHGFEEDSWFLLPWDLDSAFDEADQRLFRPTVPTIERFLQHPLYAPLYGCHLEFFLDVLFQDDAVRPAIDHLVPLFPQATIDVLREFAVERRAFLDAEISRSLELLDSDGAEVCGDAIRTPGRTFRLEGATPLCGSSSVTVAGEAVEFDPVTSRWSLDVTEEMLDAAGDVLAIRSVGPLGFVTAALDLRIDPVESGSLLPSTIDTPMLLDLAGSPYRFTDTATVEREATLRIESGVRVEFASGAGLVVRGTLEAPGTPSAPIVLAPDACGGGWSGLSFLRSAGTNLLSSMRLEGLGGDASAALLFQASDAILTEVEVDAPFDTALVADDGSTVDIRGGRFAARDVAIFGIDSSLDLQGADIGPVDLVGVLVEGSTSAGVLVDSVSITAREYGIVSRGPDLTARDLTLSDHTAAAIAVVGGEAELERVLVYDSSVGLAFSDGVFARVAHVTCVGGQIGVALTRETPAPPPSALIKSSIIWGAVDALVVDPSAVLNLTWSDTSGGLRSGEGNISEDPRFFDVGARDFRPGPSSPCRGTGRLGSDMGALPAVDGDTVHEFLRCDANGDTRNNLSDAIFTLDFLFVGGVAPACRATLDCDSDGEVSLTDAVFNLLFQFSGGAAPASPYPDCDQADIEDCRQATCRL